MNVDQLLQLLDDPAKISEFDDKAPASAIEEDQLPHDDDLPVLTRLFAVELLAALGSDSAVAVPRLVEIASSETHSDVGKLLRLEAVAALWAITGDREHVLSVLAELAKDDEWWVRARVAKLLGEIGAEFVVENLLQDEHYEVRRAAQKAVVRE